MTHPSRCQATDNGHPCHLDANHPAMHAWSDTWGLTRWDDDGNHIHHQWTEAVVSQHPSTDRRPCVLCGEPLQSAQSGARYCGDACRAVAKQAVRLRQVEKRQRIRAGG